MDAKSCFYLPGGPPENTCHVVIGPMPAAENPAPDLSAPHATPPKFPARESALPAMLPVSRSTHGPHAKSGPFAATPTRLRVNPTKRVVDPVRVANEVDPLGRTRSRVLDTQDERNSL